jgi:hypothetical protein
MKTREKNFGVVPSKPMDANFFNGKNKPIKSHLKSTNHEFGE